MTVEGPRKGEPSTETMRYGLRTQPAPLVRGSSRRIMSMQFRPAHISVINRRASSEAVIGPAVPNPLQAHQRDHVPTPPPVAVVSMPERCSPVKGSLRRAKLRRALDPCAPFRPDDYRDGRLRREHETGRVETRKPKRRPLKKLDRSLHISSSGDTGQVPLTGHFAPCSPLFRKRRSRPECPINPLRRAFLCVCVCVCDSTYTSAH